MYGIKLGELDGARCLRLDKNSKECLRLLEIFQAWQSVAAKAESVEIASGEYDVSKSLPTLKQICLQPLILLAFSCLDPYSNSSADRLNWLLFSDL